MDAFTFSLQIIMLDPAFEEDIEILALRKVAAALYAFATNFTALVLTRLWMAASVSTLLAALKKIVFCFLSFEYML